MRAVLNRLGPVVVVSAVPLLLVTCKGTEPRVPKTVSISGRTTPLTSIGDTAQYTAQVLDQKGSPLTTAQVTWATSNTAVITVNSTSGVVTAVANGIAQLTATSGSATGSISVTVAQAAGTAVASSGNGQTGTVGQPLAQPLVVLVNDPGSHPAAGVTVTFAVTSGGGSVGTSTTTTNASGQAQTTWTLGSTSGTQQVSATVSGASGSPLTFSATANTGAPSAVVKQTGDFQRWLVSQPVPTRPTVVVRDQFGNPIAGDSVTFSVGSGGGSITGPQQVTGAAGTAAVGSWTLGPAAGVNTLIATAKGSGLTGNPATFTDTAFVGGAAAGVAVLVGNNDSGLVGYAVNVRPAVRVTDANNLPVSGVSVTFAAATGGGSGTGLVATTNANGVAQVASWTLGASPGVNTMTATVSGSGIAGNPVTFSDNGLAATYDIQIQYFGPTPSAAVQTVMSAAAAKWTKIIYRSVGAVSNVSLPAGVCGTGTPAINRTITNLLILAKFDSIDGPGKILGQSGPCLVRTSNGLALLGVMDFDSSDVDTLLAEGALGDVMLHEMGHVIGFGTLWGPPAPEFGIYADCLQDTSALGSPQDTYFSCPLARAAFDSIGGLSYTGAGQTVGGNKVPVENCGNAPYVPPRCGAATVNSHWRETVLGNELMTGFIGAGTNPLSVLSVAAQEDLGYTVNYAGADPYTHAFAAPAVGGIAPRALGDDIRHGKIYVVDRSGRIVGTLPGR
jgi:hypothetical protein